jgi:hypothetical protein
MPIHEAIEDDPADYDGGAAHRARAKMMLGQIAQQARQALDEQQIDLDLFVTVPNSATRLSPTVPMVIQTTSYGPAWTR